MIEGNARRCTGGVQSKPCRIKLRIQMIVAFSAKGQETSRANYEQVSADIDETIDLVVKLSRFRNAFPRKLMSAFLFLRQPRLLSRLDSQLLPSVATLSQPAEPPRLVSS